MVHAFLTYFTTNILLKLQKNDIILEILANFLIKNSLSLQYKNSEILNRALTKNIWSVLLCTLCLRTANAYKCTIQWAFNTFEYTLVTFTHSYNRVSAYTPYLHIQSNTLLNEYLFDIFSCQQIACCLFTVEIISIAEYNSNYSTLRFDIEKKYK